MYIKMQRRGGASSCGQTSLLSVFISAFYCLWKPSQANTMPYLFSVVFWKRKDVITSQSAVICELARRRPPPLLWMGLHSAGRDEGLLGLQVGNQRPEAQLGGQAFAREQPQLQRSVSATG